MNRDHFTFQNKTEALNFYLVAVSLGIWAVWKSVDVLEDGTLYWTVIVDKDKTTELIHKEV